MRSLGLYAIHLSIFQIIHTPTHDNPRIQPARRAKTRPTLFRERPGDCTVLTARRCVTFHGLRGSTEVRAISPVQRAPAPLPLAPLRAHVRRPRRALSSARHCRRRRWHMVARLRGRRLAAAIRARISPHPPRPLSRGRRPRRHRLPAARRGDARPVPRRAPSLRRPCPWPRAAATRERGWRWRRCPRRGAAAARAAPVVRVRGEGWRRG